MKQNFSTQSLKCQETKYPFKNEVKLSNIPQQKFQSNSKEPKQKILDYLSQLIRNQIYALKISLGEIQLLQNKNILEVEEIYQYGDKEMYQELLHQLGRSKNLTSQIDQLIGKMTFKENNQQHLTIIDHENFPQVKTKYEEITQSQHQQDVYCVASAKLDCQKSPKYSTFQEEQCQVIAIDNSNKFMIAGCLNDIKIFELIDDKLKIFQIAKQHTKKITILLFMKTTNDFFSHGEDKIICIWKQKRDQRFWEVYQTIQCLEDQVLCLTIDFADKYLVYGSFKNDYSTIKFFKKFNQKWMLDFSFLVIGKIKNLCFNNSSDTLISTSDEGLFIIQKISRQWELSMSIFKKKYGTQIFFINNKKFAVQSRNENQLFIYQHNQITQDYQSEIDKFYKIQLLKNFNHFEQFPIRYLEKKHLIITKDNLCINFIQLQSNGDYVLIEKVLENIPQGNIGEISKDGLYFITWNQENQAFYVRKLEEL